MYRFCQTVTNPYFRTLFQSSFVEGKENYIHFSNYNPKAIDSFLQYLYCQPLNFNLHTDLELIVELLALAHEFQEELLVKLCSYHLEQTQIHVDNFYDILNLGILYKQELLVLPCLQFAEITEEGLPILISMLEKKNITLLRQVAFKYKLEKVKDAILNKMDEYVNQEN